MRSDGYRLGRARISSASTRRLFLRASVVFLGLILALPVLGGRELPISEYGRPFQPQSDEARLWRDSERLVRQIEEHGFVYDDPAVEAYLNSVALALVGERLEDAAVEIRIRVLKDPFLNAFALPHGVVFVHTGLLARMDNEAQLATLLAHEMTHFTHRHSMQAQRQVKRKIVMAQVLGGLAAAGAQGYGGSELGQAAAELGGAIGQLWAIASIYGYSRELETQADEVGMQLLIDAGYDVNEAPRLFEHLQRELDKLGIEEPFFFGTHPRIAERIENYRHMIETDYAAQAAAPDQRVGEQQFLQAMMGVLLENAVLDLDLGRAALARAAIDKHFSIDSQNARGHFLLGEWYRRTETELTGTDDAIDCYQTAVGLDPKYAEPQLELGLLFRERGDNMQALEAFERYLEVRLDAVDEPLIRIYMQEIEEKASTERR